MFNIKKTILISIITSFGFITNSNYINSKNPILDIITKTYVEIAKARIRLSGITSQELQETLTKQVELKAEIISDFQYEAFKNPTPENETERILILAGHTKLSDHHEIEGNKEDRNLQEFMAEANLTNPEIFKYLVEITNYSEELIDEEHYLIAQIKSPYIRNKLLEGIITLFYR